MRLLVINATTGGALTKQLQAAVNRVKRADSEVDVRAIDEGPTTIQTEVDVANAVPGVIELVQWANHDNYDAVVIACFSDPGLSAAREISRIPVLGIQETSCHIAAMLGARFTVVTLLDRMIPRKRSHLRALGLEQACASIRALGMSVAESESCPEKTKEKLLKLSLDAVERDGAEVLVLGCGGMAGYGEDLGQASDIRIVDPVSVTLKVAEALVDLGLAHSKRALYAYP